MGKSSMWNLWHGCHKWSEGCRHCYVYRGDARRGRDASIVQKTLNFDLPIRKKKNGEYKIPPGNMVYTCFSSDFLVEDADEWRPEAWAMMKERSDLQFLFLTKRIERLKDCVPPDWGEGYPNVTIGCTIEDQDRANFRTPILRDAPIKKKIITCEPLLTPIDFGDMIGPWVEQIVAGGESGMEARTCDYEWIQDLSRQCKTHGISFWFKQTGTHFRKEGKLYKIPRRLQHAQARKAGLNT